jgi:sRNA-binding regulator protein Hfq
MVILSLGIFIYAFAAMVVSRELIIPRMSQSIDGHLGGDPQWYNLLALKKVAEIEIKGIKGFELRPEGQGPAGIASLIYLLVKNVYGVILTNAFLHAVSTIVMVMLLGHWFSLRTSIIASLPLAMSPYMMIWFSQLNKDSFTLAGALLFTYGLLRLIRPAKNETLRNGMLLSLLIAGFGMFLVYIMRPYMNQMMMPMTAIVLVMRITSSMVFENKTREGIRLALFGTILFICLSVGSFLSNGAASDATLEKFNSFVFQSESQSKSPSVMDQCLKTIDEKKWRNEPLFPDYINAKLRALMGQRCYMFNILETHHSPATLYSFIDTDKFPRGSMEVLYYIPRALLIGIFAPWPDRWFYTLNHRPSVFYTIIPIETVVVYISIAGLVIWLIRRRDWLVFIPVGLSFSMMAIHGIATPFLGALYRYRYPWWMMILCLGLAACITLAEDWNRQRKQIVCP